MDILLQSPSRTSVQLNTAPSADSSLEELQALKVAWLTQAKESGDLDALRQVVRTLGSESTPAGWPLWTVYTLTRGNIRAQYFEGLGAWLPCGKAYDRIRVLVVHVGAHQVVYCRESDSRQPADNFYVPGAWVSRLLVELDRARSVFAARLESIEAKERAALAAQLLIGLAV